MGALFGRLGEGLVVSNPERIVDEAEVVKTFACV